MKRMGALLFCGMLCTQIYADLSLVLKKSLITSIQASPSLLVLIPAYVLYSQHERLGTEPISEHLDRRVHTILKDMALEDCTEITILKLKHCFSFDEQYCDSMQYVTPIKKKDQSILAVPSPHALYLDERACSLLDDDELRKQLVPCVLFMKQYTLEKSILSAVITPIATDYGIRLLSYLINIFVESICAEISEKYPMIGFVLCSSNAIIDWLLTNAITKFILNAQLVQYFTRQHLKSIEQQAENILQRHEQNKDSLAHEQAQKIAAGEVVERPANIVKELIENALDAGATSIKLIVTDGGRSSIRMNDNGCGMTPEDARLSVHPHATSKITCVDDLEKITTYGFRGEALASIAAISTLTITTKTSEATAASQLVWQQGVIVSESLIAANTGTDIHVENIFDQLPARKKFLKSRETEWRAILQLIQAAALSHLSVHFVVIHDTHEVINCPSVQTVKERIAQLFENSFARAATVKTVQEDTYGVTISGACTDSQYHRYDRSLFFFFVNGRWIKNYKLAQAVLKGYNSILPAGRYPAIVAFITCKQEEVDVNIHPRKEEVMFLHPRVIEQALARWAQQSLESTIHLQTVKQSNNLYAHAASAPSSHLAHTFKSTTYGSIKPLPSNSNYQQPPVAQEPIVHHNVVVQEVAQFHIIGQLYATYLLIEQSDGLVMIDQHAAHERILFEEYATRCEVQESIELIFPPIISLSRDDSALLAEHVSLFKEYGIIVEPHAHDNWIIRAVPLIIKQHAGQELVKQILGIIYEHRNLIAQDIKTVITQKVRAMMACKAAVKAGDVLTHTHMHELIQKLLVTENRMSCPHGRPTMWRITLSEIERFFKRT